MARKLRVQYEGAVYHVMNRGDRREEIFHSAQDHELFLATLGEACAKTDWQVHAWCLMPNHFHMVVETPKANLVDGMKWLLGTYTSRFNRRYGVVGHLFSGRYKSLIVDGSGNGYLKTACDYVHLNPVRAKLIEANQRLSVYPWSSYHLYLQPKGSRPPWLRVDRLLGEHGIPNDSAAGRAEFEKHMELRRAAEDGQEVKGLTRGWCLGSESFRKELLTQINLRAGAEHYGEEIHAAEEEKASRIVDEEIQRLGWSENSLAQTRKGDPQKVQIALRLRRETTMPLAWVAQRLRMGTRTHLAHLLYWHGKS
jgi:REP-associated tyrosine transposase